MKFLFILLSLLVSVSFSAQADTFKCSPEKGSRWTGASVSYLENSSQGLYQVRAQGAFLTADLICSSENCVGFMNGIEARGRIEFTPSDRLKPVLVTFKIEGDTHAEAEFHCK